MTSEVIVRDTEAGVGSLEAHADTDRAEVVELGIGVKHLPSTAALAEVHSGLRHGATGRTDVTLSACILLILANWRRCVST